MYRYSVKYKEDHGEVTEVFVSAASEEMALKMLFGQSFSNYPEIVEIKKTDNIYFKCDDLTGQKFGKWTVLERMDGSGTGASIWKCVCECGKIKSIVGSDLRTGRTHGCRNCSGYFRKVSDKKKSECSKPYPKSNTKIHGVWKNMKQRCFSTYDNEYKRYGKRGITVCDEWKNSFPAFYEYVSKLPHYGEEGYSLDRINNDGNYEPGNVRWATAYEQVHNRRKVVRK